MNLAKALENAIKNYHAANRAEVASRTSDRGHIVCNQKAVDAEQKAWEKLQRINAAYEKEKNNH